MYSLKCQKLNDLICTISFSGPSYYDQQPTGGNQERQAVVWRSRGLRRGKRARPSHNQYGQFLCLEKGVVVLLFI